MKKKKMLTKSLKSPLGRIKYMSISFTIEIILLLLFGFLMIISASMGEAAGDTGHLISVTKKEAIIISISLVLYFIFSIWDTQSQQVYIYAIIYVALTVALLSTRIFGATNGAYAWIKVGPLSIQPSEFCKVFMIACSAKLFGRNYKENNPFVMKVFWVCTAIWVLIIFGYQHDTGSAAILAGICYVASMIPEYKELRKIKFYMFAILLFVVIGIVIFLLPSTGKLISNYKGNNYMILRFVSSVNPFLDQFGSGYHIVMSLATIASGGWFGVGYGKSIHKYMNFPNPTNDFILPIIIEEFGAVGFLVLLLLYLLIVVKLMRASLKTKSISSSLVYLGTSMYLMFHFILNVGGVSGFIPLTGVPLLLVSSGGSSTMACLLAFGLCQNEIIKNRMSQNKKD